MKLSIWKRSQKVNFLFGQKVIGQNQWGFIWEIFSFWTRQLAFYFQTRLKIAKKSTKIISYNRINYHTIFWIQKSIFSKSVDLNSFDGENQSSLFLSELLNSFELFGLRWVKSKKKLFFFKKDIFFRILSVMSNLNQKKTIQTIFCAKHMGHVHLSFLHSKFFFMK